MKGKRFDSEFKKDIVKLYINGERTCPSLAEEFGLHENTIYKWIQQYKEDRLYNKCCGLDENQGYNIYFFAH